MPGHRRGQSALPSRRYNILVFFRQPTHATPGGRRPKHHIYATEITGLLIISLLILALTLARYWHSIHWSLR